MLRSLPRRLWSLGTVAVAAFFLIGLCWLLTTPPGGGVDEPSHYVRMVGLAHGQLLGDAVDPARPLGGLTGAQLRRVNAEAGSFELPGAVPPPNGCNALDAALPYTCPPLPTSDHPIEAVSLHARYLPGPYVLPALLSRLGSTTSRTLLLGRLGFLLQNTALFAVAVAALGTMGRTGHRWGAAALAVAVLSVTPALLFMAGTLSPSATEILAVAACAAALVALARTGSGRWAGVATACAVVACWARDLGVPAVSLALVAVVLLEPGLRTWWREAGRKHWVHVGVAGVAALGALAWNLAMKEPLAPTWNTIGSFWHDLGVVPAALRDSIGLVGWMNVRIDAFVEWLWLGVWVIAAVSVSSAAVRRVRLVLAMVLGAVLVAGVLLGGSLRTSGFRLQPRFLMPLAVVGVVVLVTATVRGATVQRQWVRAALVLCSLGQASMLLIAAHRNAHGLTDAAIDFAHTAWGPPGGWKLAAVVAVLGCAAVAVLPVGRLSEPLNEAATNTSPPPAQR